MRKSLAPLVAAAVATTWLLARSPHVARATPQMPRAVAAPSTEAPTSSTTSTTTAVSADAYLPPSSRSIAPALPVDFPDPSIIRVASTWWAYATGGRGSNLVVASSPDLRTWSAGTDPLPELPPWAAPGHTWAPGVTIIGGRFVMYYAVRVAASGRQCISVATAANPGGPFSDASAGPLACQLQDAGSIDPFAFAAPDGSLYLLWKSEDNGIGAPSRIGAQRLSADGLALIGPRRRLLTATEPWQAGVIESPAMIAVGSRYYLFYGANRWDSAHAGIGYALCDTPLGPCTNQSVSRPWLISHGDAYGPSGPDLFVDRAGGVQIAYHAWGRVVGYPVGRRALWIDPVAFVDGSPELG